VLAFDKLVADQTTCGIAGRIMSDRKMGVSSLVTRQHGAVLAMSVAMMLAMRRQVVRALDLGISSVAKVRLCYPDRERTLRVGSFELLTKALHPLPDKHSGLTDKETRYRRRYADLLVNPEVREVFRRRSQIIQIVRNFLKKLGYKDIGEMTPLLAAEQIHS
jgi:lysyl-tRNA synthetase class 2